MSIEQTNTSVYRPKVSLFSVNVLYKHRLVFRVVTLGLLSLLLFRATPTPQTVRYTHFALATMGEGFDLLNWEIDALGEKAWAAISQPIDDVAVDERPELVRDYLARAAEIGRIEADLAGRASGLAPLDDELSEEALTQEITALQARQNAIRPAVEQILQHQVGSTLRAAQLGVNGMPWPPVQFTFTDPPRKLVVSPRTHIATIYSRMLTPAMTLSEIEQSEAYINEQRNATAYITRIGGLGAYPTMVVDRAPLDWVISTVAHEWVHNYLVFFPLGWNYFNSQDMTTINESVAEIVGNEVGASILTTTYGVPPVSAEPEQPAETMPQPAAFDFSLAMRETRLEVDRLLAEGQVNEAEAYMNARRQLFLEQGYSLRVLNQAYFAFHGSYVTSPASTSPIGPKLEHLRALMPDLRTFLHTVRWFTSPDDLDQALAEWEARG